MTSRHVFLRRTVVPFLIGAPIVLAYLWVGAWIAWQIDPKDAGLAVPPWFHDGWHFVVMALYGGFIEMLMLFALGALAFGATVLGRIVIHAIGGARASMSEYSEPCRPPIPIHAGRVFRLMPATHSDTCRPPPE